MKLLKLEYTGDNGKAEIVDWCDDLKGKIVLIRDNDIDYVIAKIVNKRMCLVIDFIVCGFIESSDTIRFLKSDKVYLLDERERRVYKI